jgi:hypothetical protein
MLPFEIGSDEIQIFVADFRRLRHPAIPMAPSPAAKSGRAAVMGTADAPMVNFQFQSFRF